MIKLLIRLLSLVICVGLLAGGAYLAYIKTMENEEFFSDLSDIGDADWVAGVGQYDNDDETPEGDNQTPEGGDQTPEGGDQTPEGGDQTPEGGDQTPEGDAPITE